MSLFFDKEGNIRVARLLGISIILIFVLLMVISSFVIVQAGHRGVVLYFGAVEDRVLGEGIHLIIPFAESVRIAEVRTLKYEIDATAATKDLLDVHTKVAVNYHLEPTKVNDVYQTIGVDYQERVIAPAVQEVVKATTAHFDASELITERPIVKQQIDEALKTRLGERAIIVETISLTDFQFPAQFNEAIIAKQTAVQLKQKAENDLERIKVEALQKEAQAVGEQKANIAKATGEAKAIEIIDEQLKRSPTYINWLATNRWDGRLPLATGSGAIPFINVPTPST